MPKSDLDFAFKKMTMLQVSMQSCKEGVNGVNRLATKGEKYY